MRLVRTLNAVPLQSSQIVGISKLLSQLLEQRPVSLLAVLAHFAGQMAFQIGCNAVVIQQCVIHIDEENDFASSLKHYSHPLLLRCVPTADFLGKPACFPWSPCARLVLTHWGGVAQNRLHYSPSCFNRILPCE